MKDYYMDDNGLRTAYEKVRYPHWYSKILLSLGLFYLRVTFSLNCFLHSIKEIFKPKIQIPTERINNFFDFEKLKKENRIMTNEDVTDLRTELLSMTDGKYNKRAFAGDLFAAEIYGKLKDPHKKFIEEMGKSYPLFKL